MLLTLHIIAGAARYSRGCCGVHWEREKWHINAGRVYVVAMAVVCGSAILMSVRTGNLFLLLVGLFSFTLAFRVGGLLAIGRGRPVGRFARSARCWSPGFRRLLAGYLLMQGDSQYITMAAFGFIAIILGQATPLHRQGKAIGAERIARHLAVTLGAISR